MRSLPAFLLVAVLIAAVAAGAWGLQHPALASGSFTVEPESITEGSDLLVKRLRIVANGAKGIRLTNGAGDSSWMSLAHTPSPEAGLQHVDLVFVADKSLDLGTDHCSITWLQQITTTGSRVGGPSRHRVPRETELGEFVQLDLPQGEYAVGETLLLGTAAGQTIELTVEKH